VPLADRYGRKDVQEFVEDLRRRLGGALRKSLAHEIAAGCRENARSPGFGDGTDRADGQRHAEKAEVMVVDLVAETRVSDLVEPLEMVEARGISVRHHQAMKRNGETGLSEGLDLASLAEQLGAGRKQKMLSVMGIHIIRKKTLDGSGALSTTARSRSYRTTVSENWPK
jgi:hypothetical protein